MEAYAGRFLDEKMINQSASGGAATAISKAIIKKNGVVYGAKYSSDFYAAEYGMAETVEELERFKGSKYAYVKKSIDKNGKKISVFNDVLEQLQKGKLVLFFGLGCDVAALEQQLQKTDADITRLFTIELLCDGVTSETVHNDYIKMLEKRYNSKVVDFSLRYKKEGWKPFYIYAAFENGEKHVRTFAESDYGFAFENYKKPGCYDCFFKNENHKGDLMLADYWGCMKGMKGYNPQGVSLLLVRSDKGKKLMDMLNSSEFFYTPVDADYALHCNQRYFTSHQRYAKWEEFDMAIKEKGLHEAVLKCVGKKVPKHFMKNEGEVILWGTGNCFRKFLPAVKEICEIKYVVDSDKNKWGKEAAPGIMCIAPDDLKKIKVRIVVIMIEKAALVMQVTNELLDRGFQQFDCVHNWIYYGEEFLKG